VTGVCLCEPSDPIFEVTLVGTCLETFDENVVSSKSSFFDKCGRISHSLAGCSLSHGLRLGDLELGAQLTLALLRGRVCVGGRAELTRSLRLMDNPSQGNITVSAWFRVITEEAS
jgi:hypothetical protein